MLDIKMEDKKEDKEQKQQVMTAEEDDDASTTTLQKVRMKICFCLVEFIFVLHASNKHC